jgi:hypothetical protein
MLSIGQVTAGTASTHLCTIPAGPCLVTITNDSASAGTAYVGITPVGTAQSFTTSNGIPVPAGQSLVFANYKASPAASLAVISASTAATNVGFLISSAAGGAGF